MSEIVGVRRVRLADAARVRSIRLEALSDPAAGIAFLEKRQQAEAHADGFWQERTAGAALSVSAAQFVAETGNDWVGTLTVLIRDDGRDDSARAQVVAVYVRPSHRGAGALEALMDTAAEWARQLGRQELTLEVHEANARARRAYSRLGFALTGRSSTSRNGIELEMTRIL